MNRRWLTIRREVVRTARKMAGHGLVTGSSGNVSARIHAGDSNDLIAITPSGRAYDTLDEDGVVVVDFEVEPIEGDLTPSSETLLHAAIYRHRPDVGAVIHSHSVFCSVAAVAGLAIPPIIDEMVIKIGGAIEVSDYAFPGSEELAASACRALGERNAALIRNHGAVAVGRDLDEALEICLLSESVAQVFFYSSLLGKAHSLHRDVVDAEVAIFRMQQKGIR